MRNKKNNQKGVSLYLAIMVLGIVLAIGFGISAILLGQLKMIKGMENSVVAFYAADTGIEQILKQRNDPPLGGIPETPLPNGAKYQVTVFQGGVGGCNALNFCVKSVGTYLETKRAIEINY